MSFSQLGGMSLYGWYRHLWGSNSERNSEQDVMKTVVRKSNSTVSIIFNFFTHVAISDPPTIVFSQLGEIM